MALAGESLTRAKVSQKARYQIPHFGGFKMFTRQIFIFLFLIESLFAQELPPNLKALLMLKIIPYDRLMSEKVKSETFNIGILRKINSDSKEVKENIDNAVKNAGLKILDKNVKSIIIDYKSPAELETFLKSNNIVAIYISSDLSGNIPEIISVTRKNRVLTFIGSGIKANLKRGVSVGLGVEGGRPKIYVNLEASKKEGCEFSSQFLNLAEIIE